MITECHVKLKYGMTCYINTASPSVIEKMILKTKTMIIINFGDIYRKEKKKSNDYSKK